MLVFNLVECSTISEKCMTYDISTLNPNYIGHFTCGVAFKTMMSLFQQYRLSMFCGQEWYSAVGQSSENPVVPGFLAKHICLSQIILCGLLVVSWDVGQMLHTMFTEKSDWHKQLSSDHTIHLYILIAYNFRAVDVKQKRWPDWGLNPGPFQTYTRCSNHWGIRPLPANQLTYW